jgi:hypothetical protein
MLSATNKIDNLEGGFLMKKTASSVLLLDYICHLKQKNNHLLHFLAQQFVRTVIIISTFTAPSKAFELCLDKRQDH